MDLSFIQSPYANLALAIITVFSVIFAFYSHRVNHKFHSLSYMITGYEAFKQSDLFGFSDVTHKIGDMDVDSVFYSLLLIQNRGTIAIHPSDLNDGGDIYLRISDRISKEAKPFLLTKVVEIDDPSANISIEKNDVLMNDNQALKLKFDYLPPKSGILIECLSNINPKEFFIKTKTKDHGPISNAYPDIRKFLLIALVSFVVFIYIFFKTLTYSGDTVEKFLASKDFIFWLILPMAMFTVVVAASGTIIYQVSSRILYYTSRPTSVAFYKWWLTSARTRSTIFG